MLRPEALVPEEYVYGNHRGRKLTHAVEVRRLYEESADAVLDSGVDALLPLVPAMQPADGDRTRVLSEVIRRIAGSELSPERKKQLIGWAATFATLYLSKPQVGVIVKEISRRTNFMLNALQDLPLLRDTYQEGIEKGIRRGLVRIYERRHGPLPRPLHEALMKVTDATALEALWPVFMDGSADEIASSLLQLETT